MPGITQFKMAFELSPVILCNGIAANMQGGMLPILYLTEPNLGDELFGLDSYFAHWFPLPGGELGKNKVSTYPFANQTVAGNAIIPQPLTLSMLMVCPTQESYSMSAQIMAALKASLDQHDILGGTYTVMTPKFPYTNMLRLRTVDASSGQTHQAQNSYQTDFYSPLLTLEAAQAQQNSLMSKLSAGTQVTTPTYSGPATSTGVPSSLAAGSSGSSIAGTNVSPPAPPPLSPAGGSNFVVSPTTV